MPRSSCVFGTFGGLKRRTLLQNLHGWRTCHGSTDGWRYYVWKGSDIDDDLVDWALQQLDKITNTRPRLDAFMKYMNDTKRAKVSMWCVGARRIPHAG